MVNVIQNRRKNYLIKKGFQIKFILKFCLLVVIGIAVSGLMLYLLSGSTVTTVFENSRLTIKNTADFILPAVLLSGAIVILTTSILAIIITLYTSHRIAGPLYRIEKDLEEVVSGNLKVKFNLRGTDELQGLADNINKLTSTLRDSIGEIKTSSQELESALKVCAKQNSQLPDTLDLKMQRLQKALSKFTL